MHKFSCINHVPVPCIETYILLLVVASRLKLLTAYRGSSLLNLIIICGFRFLTNKPTTTIKLVQFVLGGLVVMEIEMIAVLEHGNSN